jgi:hypothetical protein
MKTMKQLLIVIGLVSALTICAQTMVEQPQLQMQSTSIMMGSGSRLPQAAIEGVTTTYTPGASNIPSGPHRAAVDDDTPPSDPNGPMEDPIGDAILPLALLAAAYLLFLARKKHAAN